jgi:bile acid:Na+ symporter, BASS family
MTAALLLTLKLSVVAMIFAIGLGSTPRDLSYLWRRPRQLARSLLAMYVAVPVAILLLTRLLPTTPPIRTAVFVLAISAGAPLLPRKLMKIGREGYVFSLVVTSSLLAIVAVPLWVELIAAALGRDARVDSFALAGLIAKAFLAPLLLGMLARWLLAARADRLSEVILSLAGPVLTAAALVIAYVLTAAIVSGVYLKWRSSPRKTGVSATS